MCVCLVGCVFVCWCDGLECCRVVVLSCRVFVDVLVCGYCVLVLCCVVVLLVCCVVVLLYCFVAGCLFG